MQKNPALHKVKIEADWNHNGVIIVQEYKTELDGHWTFCLGHVPAPLRTRTFCELYQSQGHYQLVLKEYLLPAVLWSQGCWLITATI